MLGASILHGSKRARNATEDVAESSLGFLSSGNRIRNDGARLSLEFEYQDLAVLEDFVEALDLVDHGLVVQRMKELGGCDDGRERDVFFILRAAEVALVVKCLQLEQIDAKLANVVRECAIVNLYVEGKGRGVIVGSLVVESDRLARRRGVIISSLAVELD